MSSREMKNIRHGLAEGGQPKKWVQEAFKPENKGKLHEQLGVPQGKKIPLAKLEKAENSKNPQLRKRAQLAETARHFNHHHKR